MIQRVFIGNQFSVALAHHGSIFTWGKRYGGRLGHSTTDYGQNSKIAAAIKTIEGDIYIIETFQFTWLNNDISNSIVGPAEYCYIPKKVCALEGKQIIDVAVGSSHCMALSSKNEVFGWGRNDFQQVLKISENVSNHHSVCRDAIIPTPVLITPPSIRISGIACGTTYRWVFIFTL